MRRKHPDSNNFSGKTMARELLYAMPSLSRLSHWATQLSLSLQLDWTIPVSVNHHCDKKTGKQRMLIVMKFPWMQKETSFRVIFFHLPALPVCQWCRDLLNELHDASAWWHVIPAHVMSRICIHTWQSDSRNQSAVNTLRRATHLCAGHPEQWNIISAMLATPRVSRGVSWD